MFPEHGGDIYRLLLRVVSALDEFIECTGPNAHPCLGDVLAAGEHGGEEVVMVVWSAARRLVDIMPQVKYPHAMPPAFLGQRLTAAFACLHATMKKLLDRWEFPMDLYGAGRDVDFRAGRYRATDDAGGMWNPIVPPIVEPAEHEVLAWCRGEFAAVGRHLESQGWGEYVDRPVQTEAESIAAEAKRSAEAKELLELKQARERSAAARAFADRIRAAQQKARAASAKALADGAKPSGVTTGSPNLLPGEIPTSLRKLARIFDRGHDKSVPEQLVFDGCLAGYRWDKPKGRKQKILIVRSGPNATDKQKTSLNTRAKKRSPDPGRKQKPGDGIS